MKVQLSEADWQQFQAYLREVVIRPLGGVPFFDQKPPLENGGSLREEEQERVDDQRVFDRSDPGRECGLQEVSFDLEGPLDLVPELCVEVLSTNRAYDRLTKRLVYATSGVRELWLVEPSGSIERWSGQGLNEAEVLAERLTTPLLPGFELDVAALFERG